MNIKSFLRLSVAGVVLFLVGLASQADSNNTKSIEDNWEENSIEGRWERDSIEGRWERDSIEGRWERDSIEGRWEGENGIEERNANEG